MSTRGQAADADERQMWADGKHDRQMWVEAV